MKDLKGIGGAIGSIISFSGLAMTTEEIANLVSIISGVVGLLITITSVLIIPFIKWMKKAKEDGKITKEEINELGEIVDNAKEELTNIKNKEEK